MRSILLTLVILHCFISSNSFGQSSQVSTVYFKSNSHSIEKKYFTILNETGQKCASDSFSFLKIFAYADTTGTPEYNEKLSEKRAYEVYNYLMQRFNIDTTKIYITWLGEETDGAYDLHFPEAKVQQRCVDILISFSKDANNISHHKN